MAPPKIRFLFGSVHPAVGERLAVEDVQRLEDADQVGDPPQLVLVEDPVGVLLHGVEGAVGHAAEQLPGVLVAHAPSFHDVQEDPDRSGAQALALGRIGEVDERRRIVPSGGVGKGHGHVILQTRSYSTPKMENSKTIRRAPNGAMSAQIKSIASRGHAIERAG